MGTYVFISKCPVPDQNGIQGAQYSRDILLFLLPQALWTWFAPDFCLFENNVHIWTRKMHLSRYGLLSVVVTDWLVHNAVRLSQVDSVLRLAGTVSIADSRHQRL